MYLGQTTESDGGTIIYDQTTNRRVALIEDEYENFDKSERSVMDAVEAFGARDIQEIILESENGKALVNNLGNDIGELERIASLSPKAQLRAMIRLETKVIAKSSKQKSSNSGGAILIAIISLG